MQEYAKALIIFVIKFTYVYLNTTHKLITVISKFRNTYLTLYIVHIYLSCIFKSTFGNTHQKFTK